MNKPLRLLFTWAGLLTVALFIDAGTGKSFLVEEAHAVVVIEGASLHQGGGTY